MTGTTAVYESDELPDETVDTVVIGGGAAGLNSALMLARSRRSVVVIDGGTPRNAPAAAMHGFIALDGMPPTEILERGREQLRQYGGRVVFGEVASTESATPAPDGDLRFTATMADGRSLTARRVLVATGLRDVLPDIPGLAEHWGDSVVHCPYCHGWEVRDKPIGVIATGAASIHHAQLFRQLSEDLIYFANGTELDDEARECLAARSITVIDTPVQEVVSEDGLITGLRLTDGSFVERRVLAVATQMQARTEGLDGLQLPMQDMPNNMGRHFASGMAGSTEVPGVWVAGNATDLGAQVGASAAAGALAGSHINAVLVTADIDAALTEARRGTAVAIA